MSLALGTAKAEMDENVKPKRVKNGIKKFLWGVDINPR
jgi:hypothetical protein